MDTDPSGAEANTDGEAVPRKASRPPPIIPTSKWNLIQLQKQLTIVVKDDIEFRNTRNGRRVTTKGMADLETAQSHFSLISYYSFLP
jgi:hypothetical protein